MTNNCKNIQTGNWCGTREDWHVEAKAAFNEWNYKHIRFKCRNCEFVGTISEWQLNHSRGELFLFTPTSIIADNKGDYYARANIKRRITIKMTIVWSNAKYTPFWYPSIAPAIN